MLEIILAMCKNLERGEGRMPPTILYNEDWLLRGILYWFFQNQAAGHPLSFQPGANWYSEGCLTSIFLPHYHKDELAERYTRADGVIGNIAVGKAGKYDVFLVDPFKQFVVLEAKLFSKLAGGTPRIPGYNQVARSIVCMASVLWEARCPAEEFASLGYYVLAPEQEIETESSFYDFLDKESVRQSVLDRVELYQERSNYLEKRQWFEDFFEPLLAKINLLLISWEEAIFAIKQDDEEMGQALGKFYARCLVYNAPGN